MQSCTSTDKTRLDLLMKQEEQDAAERDAHLALEMRREERKMKWEEQELRQEERELQESKECKEAEDKRMKISLAQTLMGSGDAEL